MRERIWSQYNKELVQRGSLTFLIDPKLVKSLKKKQKSPGAGRPIEFSSSLIELLMKVKVHFRMAYRFLEGFAKSFLPKFIPGIKIPSYSLICKRVAKLEISLPNFSGRRASVVILDSSGMKVVGEGERKVKIHGRGRPRKWVKVHIAIDAVTQEIVAEITTESNVGDSRMTEALLSQIPNRPSKVIADGGYDCRQAREAIKRQKAVPLIPPPKNGRYKGVGDERDNAILEILGLGNDRAARTLWGKLTGYNRRVLVESAFSSLKRLFGDRFFSKTIERQCIENRIRCSILNQMKALAG